MSWHTSRRILVLGGIRSGKSELGEELVARAGGVRYVATGGAGDADPEWVARVAAHQARRPAGWATEEIGADPARLLSLLSEAKPDETLLIDDLGGWLTATLDASGGWDGGGSPAAVADAGQAEPATAEAGPDTAQAEPADYPDDLDDVRGELAEDPLPRLPQRPRTPAEALADTVRDCPAALLVLISPEVGLSVVPATAAGRTFTDAIGAVNQAVAQACDAVALVVAGQPTWLKGTDPRRGATAATAVAQPAPAAPSAAIAQPASAPPTEAPPTTATAPTTATPPTTDTAPTTDMATAAADTASPGWADAVTAALPLVTVDTAGEQATTATEPTAPAESTTPGQPGESARPADDFPISVSMDLPMPDEAAAADAGARLATLNFAGAGLGRLTPIVRFAAGTQGQPVPRPWQAVRTFILHADHDGDIAAGDSRAAAAERLAAAERGEGAWALLAGAAGVAVHTVRCPGSGAAIEHADALRESDVDIALRYGWQLAQEAVDSGTDLIVLGASGAGADAAAVAVIVTQSNGEAAALLGRVIGPSGRIDDAAWMRRCAAVRDALHRTRSRARDPKAVLGMLGGADHAVATGIILGAVSRRTPVLLDGPVGVASALVARDFGAQTRHWIVLPDDGGHPAVRLGAEVLGAEPVLDLRLDLGEGATALAALPLLRSALTLAATLPESTGA